MQASITWKQCAELPTQLDNGRGTVINGKVYCGGATEHSGNFLVYCYNPSEDKWIILPPVPVQRFGLGQVNGKLVVVGGEGRGLLPLTTNEVYTFIERLQVWKQTIPPMPTVRKCVSVLSFQSALVVAGGIAHYASSDYLDTVEIFKPDTSQWYRTDPLPTACCLLSLVAIGNTCYAIGGYNGPAGLNQALYASVDDLLGNAVPANQTTHSGTRSNKTKSAWKTLPNTPRYRPAAAVLAGNLFAVGGQETSEFIISASKSEVFMYSSFAKSWIHVSDLPAPRSGPLVAVLSPTEILAIGGWIGASFGDWIAGSFVGSVNTVYKGTLHLK
jgi:N-acetylneuraminic acid mutarotase